MEVTHAFLHRDLTWSQLTWASCFMAKFRGYKKERGTKLQGKMEMESPRPPLVLIPLGIRVFYSQRSLTHPKQSREHHSSTQLSCRARTEPKPAAGSEPTQRSVLWGHQCARDAAFSNDSSVGLQQGTIRTGILKLQKSWIGRPGSKEPWWEM